MYYKKYQYLENIPDIKIFLSSTFKDLNSEREALMKTVFPKIEEKLKKFSIRMFVVDLRWGIKEEDIHNGDTLSICLDSVEKCQPYFIGLLGGRYGWEPTADDVYTNSLFYQNHKVTVDRYISDHMSITEMEIRFGVLERQSNTPIISHFYFGDETKYKDIPENYENLDDYQNAVAKQKQLKTSIGEIDGLVGPGFSSLKDITDTIAHDLEVLIRNSVETELNKYGQSLHYALSDEEETYIEQYRFEKRTTEGYLERECDHDIQRYIHNIQSGEKSVPLYVTGNAGNGKSAAIANASIRIRQKAETELVRCYVGTGNAIVSYKELFLDIAYNVASIFNPDADFSMYSGNPKAVFEKALSMIDQPTIILIDGIDQIEDKAHIQQFLPETLPASVGVIIGTAHPPGHSKYEFGTIHIRDYSVAQQKAFIQQYLANYAKDIDPSLLAFLCRDINELKQWYDFQADIQYRPIHSSPFFIKSLLREICLTGMQTLNAEHTQYNRTEYQKMILAKLTDGSLSLFARNIHDIVDLVHYYWNSNGNQDFYYKLIERYECLYGSDLVRDMLCLLVYSRDGLYEEAYTRLIIETQRHPGLHYYALMSQIEPLLVEKAGQYTIQDPYLLEAIDYKYAYYESQAREVLLEVFSKECEPKKYFNNSNPAHLLVTRVRPTTREEVREYTYQLVKLERWQRWLTVIYTPHFFEYYFKYAEDEVMNGLKRASAVLNVPLAEILSHLTDIATESADHLDKLKLDLIILYRNLEMHDELAAFYQKINAAEQDLYEGGSDAKKAKAETLRYQADILASDGKYREAIQQYLLSEGIWSFKKDDNPLAVIVLQRIALCYKYLKEYDQAIAYYLEAAEVCLQYDNAIREELFMIYASLTDIYQELHEDDESIEYLKKAEYAATNYGGCSPMNLLMTRYNITCVHVQSGEYKQALALLDKIQNSLPENPGEEYVDLQSKMLDNMAFSHMNLANQQASAHNLEAAMVEYTAAMDSAKKLVKLSPSSVKFYFEILGSMIGTAARAKDVKTLETIQSAYIDYIKYNYYAFKLNRDALVQAEMSESHLSYQRREIIEAVQDEADASRVSILYGGIYELCIVLGGGKDSKSCPDLKQDLQQIRVDSAKYSSALFLAKTLLLIVLDDAEMSDVEKVLRDKDAVDNGKLYCLLYPNSKPEVMSILMQNTRLFFYGLNDFSCFGSTAYIGRLLKILSADRNQTDRKELTHTLDDSVAAEVFGRVFAVKGNSSNDYMDIYNEVAQKQSKKIMLNYFSKELDLDTLRMLSKIQFDFLGDRIYKINYVEDSGIADDEVHCIGIFS